MIEKHIYQCEVCGKEFAFEDECREHEMKCKNRRTGKVCGYKDLLLTSHGLKQRKRTN